MLDLQTGNIVDEFQQYVQPQDCPNLSEFCKELTGISQVIYRLHDIVPTYVMNNIILIGSGRWWSTFTNVPLSLWEVGKGIA